MADRWVVADMSFIGIDLGTSFIKGAVLDVEARRLEHIQRISFPDQLADSNPLHCEFDPNEIVAAVRTLVNELTIHAPSCEGIIMCSQMHGMVLMNERGEARSNCLSWGPAGIDATSVWLGFLCRYARPANKP